MDLLLFNSNGWNDSDFYGRCRMFEEIAVYCETYSNFIPVAFILGFYVALVISRYWEQLNLLPWPHRLATFASSLVQGNDSHGRLLRRTILRYANLAYVLTMRSICFPVKKRFPTLTRITETGTSATVMSVSMSVSIVCTSIPRIIAKPLMRCVR